MTDPLAEVIGLLEPRATVSKSVDAAGAWLVTRGDRGRVFYAAILEGECRLAGPGRHLRLRAGDFVLIPSALDFTASSLDAPSDLAETVPTVVGPGLVRLGDPTLPPDVRMLVGYCAFGSDDAPLLVSLLPGLVHLRAVGRLGTLAGLVDDEFRAGRPAREVVLARLLEVMLIEAFRSVCERSEPPGLLRGLADERVAVALRLIHERPAEPWTVPALAREAALSRSGFFERFRRTVGVTPMDYLLHWRMALARDLLSNPARGMADVAERVGYGSASTFSVAFTRHVGVPPIVYARQSRAEPAGDEAEGPTGNEAVLPLAPCLAGPSVAAVEPPDLYRSRADHA